MDGQALFALLQARDGTLWFGLAAPGGLCAIRGGKVECSGAESFGHRVYALYEDPKGNLWVAADKGLWRWKPGPPEHYPLPVDLYAAALTEGDNGTLLLATLKGLKQLAGGKIQDYTPAGLTGQFGTYRLLPSSDGSLWVGTSQGLLHLHQGRTDVYGSADGLTGDGVTSIFEDREGNVWVATVDGLDRFREYAVPTISRNQGLSASFAFSVQATAEGTIWISTTDGLNRWKNGHVTVYGKRSGPGQSGRKDEREVSANGAVTQFANNGLAGNPRSLGLDDQGRLWVSTGDGVFYFEGGRFVRVPGVAGGEIYGIAADGRRKEWIINGALGLFYLTPGDAVQTIPWRQLGYKGLGAGALLPDRSQGGVWLGFYEGGLVYVKDGQVRASYTAADGLGSGRVNQLRFGSLGWLWAATEGGLSRIKEGHVATLTSKNGLPCDEVHWSMEDDDHFIWLYMPCGLVRIARDELNAWVSDPSRKPKLTIFDNSDGVASVGGYGGGYGPHVTKSPDGKIWFAQHDGVSVIDPWHLPFNKLPPPVQVEQITADGKVYEADSAASGQMWLPPLVRNLAIDYTALSLAVPEKVRFRFKLEGQDKDWREVVNDRQVQYSNLAPKHYRFLVKACNNSGVWNEEGASLDFSIAPAYYQTKWFQALCLVAFVALLWAVYQFRLRQMQQRFNAGLEARVNERTRIARELHDTLLQSFHAILFQFQAARNVLPQRPEQAMQTMDEAIVATEQAIAEGRDAIRDLRPQASAESDLEQLLTTAGHELAPLQDGNRQSAAFRVVVEGKPKKLLPMLQDEVYRIGREVIRNAFRHASAAHIEVEIRYDQRHLRLRIRDDGKGIERNLLQGGSGSVGHWGLPGMRERAQRIGAKLDFWSEAGAGTEVELTVPAKLAYETARDGSQFRLFRMGGKHEQRS